MDLTAFNAAADEAARHLSNAKYHAARGRSRMTAECLRMAAAAMDSAATQADRDTPTAAVWAA